MTELTADGAIVIEVLTPSNRDDIRRYCEAGLLDVTGARELRFVIRLPAEPPPLRRMP
ncbi:hypothetical protein J4G48_0012880 [Bradyrhizobium barranii subsp. apii]|uniref:hypothetical protein n=1 Tax=Bradyrhizobium barranii TaxID=2992140 RepID=UPI001AA0DF5F|nr:hypothetical protein [Bradyrhizobium barranii]UPT98884.1 hypothetical protein J4G48_0012880 [Bradyrhizobium barranii subsp. apii]